MDGSSGAAAAVAAPSPRLALRSVGRIVHHQDCLCGIRLTIRIAQRGPRAHGGRDRQAIQLYAVPRTFLYGPRQQSLVACETSLSVGEALRDINIGRARLDIVAANLLGLNGCEIGRAHV